MTPTLANSSTTALNPFATIQQSPLGPFIATLDVRQVLAVIFGSVFVLWLLYSLIVLYHWIRYGHRSTLAIPSFLTHVVVSGVLFLFALTAF